MSINGDQKVQRIQYQIEESSKLRAQKFKMFFAGLVFATVSFIGTHPVNVVFIWLKIFESISLFSLLLSGLILLAQLAEYKIIFGQNVSPIKKTIIELIFTRVIGFWLLFIIGMGLMVVDRSAMLFLNA